MPGRPGSPGRSAGPPVEAGAPTDAPADAPADAGAVFSAQWVPMVRLALLLVDDRASAEDVVADAMGDLHRAWPRLAGPERAVAYLRVAVVNRSRSLLRRRRTVRGWVAPHAAAVPSPEEDVLLGEQRREVVAAVRALPRRQREVVVLRYWSGLDEAGIAAALGVSRGTVKSTASRALAAVERALAAGDAPGPGAPGSGREAGR